jgi:Flp pilus assembly protein TadG
VKATRNPSFLHLNACRGQALVEFALVAPVVLLLIGATVDMGRGLLIYTLLQGASRDTARQAALSYYSGSNTLPPDCTALTPTPCPLSPLVNGAHQLDALGVSVVYVDSAATNQPPAGYGTWGTLPTTTQPGTINLTGAAANTVYVFIYELDSTINGPNPSRWSCPSCVVANGAAVRTSGHQRAVVDLKFNWQPVMARFLGIPTVITFDSQTVVRMEY